MESRLIHTKNVQFVKVNDEDKGIKHSVVFFSKHTYCINGIKARF